MESSHGQFLRRCKPAAGAAAALLPVSVSAAEDVITVFKPSASTTLNLTVLANKFSEVANSIIPFLIALAIACVVWGLFKYVRAAGDAEKIAEGRKAAVYGIVALFFMLAFWGFVQMIKRSLFT